MTEDFYSRHVSVDPVFDSVAALYLYEKMDDRKDEVVYELSDSVVLLDFEESAWERSNLKSRYMTGWHRESSKFKVRKVRKRINVTVCRKGHLLSGNTLFHNGANTCKTCNAEYARKWRRKQKEREGLKGSGIPLRV